MKQAMKIIAAATTLILTAITIIFMVNYFNRGKTSATEKAEGLLSIIDGISLGGENLTAYDGMNVQGSIVISMIESLSEGTSSTPILVYTSGGTVVSEYTKSGATKNLKLEDLSLGVYAMATEQPTTENVAEVLNGEYKQKSNGAYINPTQTYSVKCYYTPNEALAFVTITHKSN